MSAQLSNFKSRNNVSVDTRYDSIMQGVARW